MFHSYTDNNLLEKKFRGLNYHAYTWRAMADVHTQLHEWLQVSPSKQLDFWACFLSFLHYKKSIFIPVFFIQLRKLSNTLNKNQSVNYKVFICWVVSITITVSSCMQITLIHKRLEIDIIVSIVHSNKSLKCFTWFLLLWYVIICKK